MATDVDPRSGPRSRTSPTSGPDDRHFTLDAVAGELRLGPAVRLRGRGLCPPWCGAAEGRHAPPARLPHRRRRAWQCRGPARSSVCDRRSRTSSRVENRRAGRRVASTARRSTTRRSVDRLLLRTRGRAVTTEDFEHLAARRPPRSPASEPSAAGEGADAGSVRVLVVPTAKPIDGRLRFEQLVPSGRNPAADHRPARGDPGDRDAARGRATGLPGRHGRRPPPGQAAHEPDPPPGGCAPTRSTASSTRSTAARTATGWPFGRPVQLGRAPCRAPAVAWRRAGRGPPASSAPTR